MTHAQRRAGLKIHLHALFWASIILLSTSACDVALAKSKILADTKFGLITWGKDLLIVAPDGDTVEIHGGDGVMLPFNAEPSDYWKLAEGTLVAQVEGQNEVALLFQRTAGPCVPRYRLLLLKLSEPARAPGTSQTYREPMGGLSRPFGTCMEGHVKLELPREDLVTVTMPSKAQGGNALFEFDIESDMNSVRLLGGLNEKFIPDQISPPCLSGICLGDEIAKHATSIDWKLPKIEVTKGNSPFSELYLLQERALGIPAGSGKNIYLTGENADGVTIDFYQKHPSFANFNGPIVIPDTAMVRVDGPFIQALTSNNITFCRDVFFRAGFYSSSGYPTWVTFRPDAQGKLRVTELIRDYPLSNQEEVNATIISLHKEYPFLAGYPLSNSDLRFTQTESDGWFAGPWGGQFKLFQYTNGHELYLAFNYKNVGNSGQLKKNPACPQRVIRNSID